MVRLRPTEQAQARVVLTGTCSLSYLSTATVAMVTSSEVVVDEDDGMPKRCTVNLHQVHTVEHAALGARLTELSAAVMLRVESALEFALGFGEPDDD